MVHARYAIRGGEDESTDAESQLLRDRGHDLDLFEDTNTRIPALDRISLAQLPAATAVAAGAVWSHPSYRALRRRIRHFRPDVVHVQNFFPLISPSAYYAAHAENVPVVQSLRNYRLLCANGSLFRDGSPCRDCLGRRIPSPAVRYACYRDSRAASAAVAAMQVVHRTIRTWDRMVNLYVAASESVRDTYTANGFPAHKVVVKPNFVYPDPGPGPGDGEFVLFVGRLDPAKGIAGLLRAWDLLTKPIALKIVGDGPLRHEVTAYAEKHPHVEWSGRLAHLEVMSLMGRARAVIVPSEWPEPFGRVAVEALAAGTPVIAANIGGLGEIVTEGRTGLLFSPGNPVDLARRVQWAMQNPSQLTSMRSLAREEFERRYSAEADYPRLMSIYRTAIG